MNTVGQVLTAYYNLLNGQVGLPVYKLTVPESVTTNYVWLYPEGGSDNNNKQSKNEVMIIRADIITFFENDADQTNCENADTAIYDKVIPSAGQTGLTSPAGLQILNVTRENYQYVIERNGNGVAYRKITRYSQRVHQT